MGKTMVLILILIALFIALFFNPPSGWGQTPTLLPQNPDTTISIKSDSTWRIARSLVTGWEKVGFDDGGWEYSIAPSRGLCSGKIGNFEGDPMWAPHPVNKETVYFRKIFELEDVPTSAYLKVGMDDDGEVYINGTSVLSSWNGVAGLSEGDVTKFLKKGTNTMSIVVKDTYGVCQSAEVYLLIKIPYADKYELGVPQMKQSTPTWSSLKYAGGSQDNMLCGSTIGECGCSLTSLAMLLSFHGVIKGPDNLNTTPDVLNEYLSKNQVCDDVGCVSDGYVYGDVVWGAIHQYTKRAHERFDSPKVMLVGIGPYDKNQVIADIKSDKPVILKAPGRSHWFVASGIVGKTLTIRDPLFDWSVLDNIDYNNSASQMRRFSKVHSDFSAIEVFVKSPNHILITSPDGKRVGFDQSTQKPILEIPGSIYIDETIAGKNTSDSEIGVVRHAIIQTPQKGEYSIRLIGPSSDTQAQIVTFSTNRQADNLRDIKNNISIGTETHMLYDPDFVLDQKDVVVTPSPTTPTLPTPEEKMISEKAILQADCRGGENRTPTARTPCAHSTIILLPVFNSPFLAPACYNLSKFDGGYNLRQSSLFFASDYFIIN